MKIGNIDLGERPVVLAPMEDVTDASFRILCREAGAAMVTTEFVPSDGLIRDASKAIAKMRTLEEESPVAIQIYGHIPESMVDAARMADHAAELAGGHGADAIDINWGCPVSKIAGRGAGSGMLREPDKLVAITKAVVDAVKKPVTVKTRLGWDDSSKIIVELAERLQDVGIQALTIHGRTRSQMYTGNANWEPIAQVKRNPRIHIPIIGNGDIDSAGKAVDAFDNLGVDAIMVGRATFGRPWIFKEIHDALFPDAPIDTTGIINSPHPPMSTDWKLDALKQQVLTSISHVRAPKAADERDREHRGILHSRRHIANSPIFKGIPNFRERRIAMLRAETADELFSLMEEARPLIQG